MQEERPQRGRSSVLEDASLLEDVKSRLIGDSTPPSSSTTASFSVRTELPLERREHEEFIEEIGTNESGLSWGVKQARDGTWREKWMEQSISQKQPGAKAGEVVDTQVKFGRCTGSDERQNSMWTAEWRETTMPNGMSTKTVDKNVTRESPSEISEKWFEDIVITRDPQGTDWTEKRETKQRGESATADQWQLHETVCRNAQSQEVSRSSTRITVNDAEHRSETASVNADGSTLNEITLIIRNAGKSVKRAENAADGTKQGSEQRYDAAGNLQQSTTWTEDANGNTERTDISFPNSSTERKYRTGFNSATKETWHEVIETEKYDSEFETETKKTVDRWWFKENDKWGNKEITTQIFRKTEQNTNVAQIQEESIERENWHDHSGERLVDSWKVRKQRRSNGTVERCVESGTKSGCDSPGGTTWWERWERVYEPAEPGAEITAECPLCPDSADCDGLLLRSTWHDKWWDETSKANRWGEQRYADLKLNEERNEDWYANGTEEQHDIWELRAGVRKGEKHGWSTDGRRKWNEKWEGQKAEAQYSIDKWWEDSGVDGGQVRWGNVEGASGGREWNESWGSVGWTGGASRTWLDRHCRHPGGNEVVEHQGTEVSANGTNWWHDRYGTHFDEKWATKKGANDRGEEWEDRWNETPNEKRASKTGRNREGEWFESWCQQGEVKWAEKRGKNHEGDEWSEGWVEEGKNKKAVKKGKNRHEEWEERWGEEFGSDGGQKWADRWSRRHHDGDTHGESWGEQWTPGRRGHKWYEKWRNGDVHVKWAHDTDECAPPT